MDSESQFLKPQTSAEVEMQPQNEYQDNVQEQRALARGHSMKGPIEALGREDPPLFPAPKGSLLSSSNASQPALQLRDGNLGLLMNQAPQDLTRVKQSVRLSLGPIQTKRQLPSKAGESPSKLPQSLMQASILRSKRQYANL